MDVITLGSSLRSVLGLEREPYSESIVLSELQEASSRLTSRLDGASLSRTELIALAIDLEPVAAKLIQVRKSLTRRLSTAGLSPTVAGCSDAVSDGRAHAVRLVDRALRNISDCLYYTRLWQLSIGPGALQAKLWNAQHSLVQALIALRWAQVEAGARA